MVTLGDMFKIDSKTETSLPGGVCVVANGADIDRLRADDAGALGAARLVALPLDAALPDALVAQASLLVVEVDPADPASVRRLAQVRSARADLPIIAAIKDANVAFVRTLVRQGISDVATLPFAPAELASQILDAGAHALDRRHEAVLAPMVTVVRGAGGCGATSVLTHLAAELARTDARRKVCVIDLDVQSGEIASYLGHHPSVTVADLLEARERLDREFLRSALIDSQRGFSLIAAPNEILPLDEVDLDQLLKLLHLVRDQFDLVLVDLPADWTNWTLSVALASTDVVMVTDLSIASLRKTKRRLELLSSVGFPARRARAVVNRAERRLFKPIGLSEVQDALNCEVIGSLAAEGGALCAAQDQGLLLTETAPKSRFAADIRKVAEALTQTER